MFQSYSVYRYVFKFLVDVSIANAYILYKNYVPVTDNKFDYKTFRMRLADELIGDYNSRKRYSLPKAIYDIATQKATPSKKRKIDSVSTSEGMGHFPVKTNKLKCWYCWNVDNVRHESRIGCKACSVSLCIEQHNG